MKSAMLTATMYVYTLTGTETNRINHYNRIQIPTILCIIYLFNS